MQKMLTPDEIMKEYPIAKLDKLPEKEKVKIMSELIESIVFHSSDKLKTRLEIDKILTQQIECKLND